MNEKEMYEINLGDMIIEIMTHWRGIFIAAVLGALVLCGLRYYKDYTAYNNTVNTLARDPEWQAMSVEERNQSFLEQQMTSIQIENVKTVLAYEEAIREREHYLNESEYMKLDSQNHASADITYAIHAKVESPQEALIVENTIRELCGDYLISTDFRNYVQQKGIVDIEDISELISISDARVLGELGSNILDIGVIYKDEEGCKALSDALISYLDEKISLIKNDYCAFEMELENYSVGRHSSSQMAADKKQVKADIAAYRTSANASRKVFTDKEIAYYEYMRNKVDDNIDGVISEEESLMELDGKPKVSKKFLVLGFLGFAFLYACIWMVLYVLDNKIKICNCEKTVCGIRVLGIVSNSENSKKRVGSKVDDLLEKIRHYGRRRFTGDDAVKLIVARIQSEIGNNRETSVILTSCCQDERSSIIEEMMKNELGKIFSNVNIVNDILYKAESLTELQLYSTAVIIETAGKTKYSEVVNQKEILATTDVGLVGIVVVE